MTLPTNNLIQDTIVEESETVDDEEETLVDEDGSVDEDEEEEDDIDESVDEEEDIDESGDSDFEEEEEDDEDMEFNTTSYSASGGARRTSASSGFSSSGTGR